MKKLQRFAALLWAFLALTMFAPGALAMTEDRAIERVKEVDPAAAGAVKFWVCPDRDAPSWGYPEEGLDGAWVFYAEDKSHMPWHGRAWFVSEDKAVDLGRSRDVYDWGFIEYKNSMNDDGVMSEAGDIFTGRTRPDGQEHLHAWTLVEGEVAELDTDGKLFSLHAQGSCLYGQAAPRDYDYAFLCMNGGILREVAAATMTPEQFSAFDGSGDVLHIVQDSGLEIGEILYRTANPGIDGRFESYLDAGGVVTLNLTTDGRPAGHVYAFIERGTRTAALMGGWWGDDLGLFEEEWGTAKREVAYEVIQTEIR